jgi:energy-converting hydrogenase A subunit F
MIGRISRLLSNYENLLMIFALASIGVIILVLVSLPFTYDRGGPPFTQAHIALQYPENSPYAGYVTAYLTPFSQWIADTTLYMGTTIVSHPGGILDEILYNTRGLDTVVETTILFIAFAIGSYLFRRRS